MALILLLLPCFNHNNLILKLHQKISFLDEEWLFIGSFKIGSVPGMTNKEMLPKSIYKPAQSTENMFI